MFAIMVRNVHPTARWDYAVTPRVIPHQDENRYRYPGSSSMLSHISSPLLHRLGHLRESGET